MKKRAIAIGAILFAGTIGLAHAKPATFSSVPANISDAPVERWIDVERLDEQQLYQWRVRIPNGMILVSQLWKGVYWPEAWYSSKNNVLKIFRQSGFDNFRRIESTASHGSKWGYIAMGKHKTADCVVGAVMGRNDFHHDGDDGGNLRGFAVDCGGNAESRYDDWKTWLRSFKHVPEGYNAKLN